MRERRGEPVKGRLVASCEDDACLAVCSDLAGDRGTGDGAHGMAGALLLRPTLGQHLGKGPQLALVARLEPLGDGDHERRIRQQSCELLAGPMDPERVDPAQHDLSTRERLRRLLQLVGPNRRRQRFVQPRVDAAGLHAVNDLAVEMGAHKAHLMSVVHCGHRQGRAHHARSQNGHCRHRGARDLWR